MPESLSRRRLLYGSFAFAALAATGGLVPVRAAALTLTPAQTEGPFYPVKLPLDKDNDLVQVQGRAAQAMGKVTHVIGRVRDREGRPIANALVELWQCDARGVYLQPQGGDGRDENFQGYGQTLTDGAGGYRFRTIRPVEYTGRTPHIHFKVAAPGHRPLTTQMYVAGERQNARDFVYAHISSAEERASVTVALEPSTKVESGALMGVFEIVVA